MSSKSEETKNIGAAIIIEVIGRPPEHLTETLENLIKQIDAEEGVKVTGKKLNEPKLMKDQTDFYTAFAEVELEVEDILYLAILMFKYMPAHIEVIYPELIALTNNGWNDIFNELTRRLHGYDEVARILQLENAKMQRKMQEISGKEILKKPEKAEKKISKIKEKKSIEEKTKKNKK
jgi:hypothetical protein